MTIPQTTDSGSPITRASGEQDPLNRAACSRGPQSQRGHVSRSGVLVALDLRVVPLIHVHAQRVQEATQQNRDRKRAAGQEMQVGVVVLVRQTSHPMGS